MRQVQYFRASESFLSVPLNPPCSNEAVHSLYAKGMTTRDIQTTLQDLYHVDVSASFISKVTEVVNEEVQQWRDRPLEAVYAVMRGYKELLVIWIAEHEGA